MIEIDRLMSEATSGLIKRVQRSLVALHNGQLGIGCGVIWDHSGLILTNHHVIAHGNLLATLPDRHERRARLVADDPEIDLALLRIEAEELSPAFVADSRSLRVGQLVLAVGHPWGQRGSVTFGLVSGLGKARTGGPRHEVEVLRTDAQLAPGNSGGPLVNAAGGVVGINTMIVGGDQGIAIPSHIASAFVDKALGKTGGTKHPGDGAGLEQFV